VNLKVLLTLGCNVVVYQILFLMLFTYHWMVINIIVTDVGGKTTRFYFLKGFGMMCVNYKICHLCDAVTPIKPVALYL